MKNTTNLLLPCAAILMLAACVSDFGQREHAFLRHETETTLTQKIIKGQTTRSEIETLFGKPAPYEEGCYSYHVSSMPFYNFLPTNFLYMKSRSEHWRLCIDYNGDTVRDYRFSHTADIKTDSPAGSLLKDFADGLRPPLSKPSRNPL
ncbi:glucosamine-fructose-6-phosphate aminotransferase [Neisseria animalis]|uniref:Glucosamine-fructose-6-phosphate aminotransferase n=1 Tax=Neisseria animalis TaxID=492 RepID=A0A5P3MU45_NEIAN|nr:glucosamine-fructose-6-phosphate aminotransferase [Neisseria animalis]QEY24179.1 glucosamine-fructose-6-phosphate aminotransferase [Neisseria animalis]ROW32212.1 glucosamine-fructose-6-phosphate aminotransferase [Neisseria animalis]VEE06459.1 putative secreted protein [Neisseria animalis]